MSLISSKVRSIQKFGDLHCGDSVLIYNDNFQVVEVPITSVMMCNPIEDYVSFGLDSDKSTKDIIIPNMMTVYCSESVSLHPYVNKIVSINPLSKEELRYLYRNFK